ncbi:MAG TPA: hypothetical protein VEJ45_10685 [Candidatus Acidoferrales bacterium]|nr:hypothetical protein [Candidatus Acidoferrales bacterium]
MQREHPDVAEQASESSTAKSGDSLRGCFRMLFLYDVAEAIDLGQLKQLLGPRGDIEEPRFGRGTPEYIRFEVPPYMERADPVHLSTGQSASCSLRYYPFAVIALQLELPFAGDWDQLVREAARWSGSADLEKEIRALVREHVDRAAKAITRLHKHWLHESYLIVNLEPMLDRSGQVVPGQSLLSTRRQEIAGIVWGEERHLATSETDETFRATLSYYPSDLIVVSSSGAFVYDRPEEAAAATQLLEYTKMQLLELRYYDGVMSRALAELYDALERQRSVVLSRWTLSRDARRMNRIRLDVTELTERIDNDIKFVSDVYYARVHHLAATRMGVSEYREMVDEKLSTARELYEFMVGQFNEARSFILEVAIAILALLDVIYLIRGH